MGFQQRRTTHAGWLTTAPAVVEAEDQLGWDKTPESGETQLAHAQRRRQLGAAVAGLCFTALVFTPELLASTPAPGPIEAAQAQARTLTQYQSIAAPVSVPAVTPAVPELTPPVYPRTFLPRPARAAYQRAFAWHPDTPVVVVPSADLGTGPIEAAYLGRQTVVQYQASAGPVRFLPPVFDVSWTGPSNGGWNFIDGPLNFTLPGSYTLTFTITASLRVQGAAGGGNGANGLADAGPNTKGGGGGGAGATDAIGEVVTVTAGPSYTVTVGAAGGLTDFSQGATVYLRLNGGSAGSVVLGGTGGGVVTGAHAVVGEDGGFGGTESSSTEPNTGVDKLTGAGGGGGGGYAGVAGADGGDGRDQTGGSGGGPSTAGGNASGFGGASGTGTAGGGGGGGGGVLLGGSRYGGGGGGGGGGHTGAGNGGAGSSGILVLAAVPPEGRPPTDTGSLYPDRAWQYQQVAAPVLVDVAVVVPPSGAATGGCSVTEAAQAQARAVTQYQASAGPVFVRKPGPADWTPTAPTWFARKRGLTAGQQQATAGPLVVPDVTVATPPFPQTVYPNRLERRQRAFELVTRIPVYVPDMTDITPEMTPPVYPSRLQRQAPLPQHLPSAQPVVVIEPETVPTYFGAVFPNRLDARARPQHQAFAWAPQTPEDYPVGSATATYPRWFPLRPARAAYVQALGWSTFTPPDVTPGDFFFTSVYPRRLDRARRTLEGYKAAPVYVPDVTSPPPTLQPPPVYPRWLARREAFYGNRGTVPSYGVGPILPPTELPVPPHECVTAPPTAGCWPPDDDTPPSVKPIGRLGRQRP